MSKQVNKEAIKWRSDPVRMNNLRMKFVEQCKQYFGVPYAKKYQQPGSKISTCVYSNVVHEILIEHERPSLTKFPNTETRVENTIHVHHAVECF